MKNKNSEYKLNTDHPAQESISYLSILGTNFHLSRFPNIKVFSSDSAPPIKWPKYWNFGFSISPSNEYSALISFRIDWFDLLAAQENSQESSSIPQFKSINSLTLSFLYGPNFISIHDYWKNDSFDYIDICC